MTVSVCRRLQPSRFAVALVLAVFITVFFGMPMMLRSATVSMQHGAVQVNFSGSALRTLWIILPSALAGALTAWIVGVDTPPMRRVGSPKVSR